MQFSSNKHPLEPDELMILHRCISEIWERRILGLGSWMQMFLEVYKQKQGRVERKILRTLVLKNEYPNKQN
jgi:hypothetical protein